MNCEQIQPLLEAYALNALNPDEQAQVEQHLAACPTCQRLLNEYTEVTGLLPDALAAASPVQPPASLKESLLQKVKGNSAPADNNAPGESPQMPGAATPPLAPTPSTNGKPQNERQPHPLWQWLLRPRGQAVGTAAILILLVLTIFLGVRLSVVLAEERALQAELANLFNQQEVVLEVVDSENTIKRVLLAPEPRPDSQFPSYGKLYTRTDLPHVVAMVARLPQPPAGQAYHFWVTNNNQTKLAGVMEVNDDGFGLVVFDAPRIGPTYQLAQLTLQPTGSTAPSGEPILVWDASQQ